MTAVLWIVVIVVVLVIAGLAVVAMQRRRSATLRQRFGSEYDRTLEGHESQRAAEAELRDRERQRAQLDIKPLSAESRARYTEEWHGVQERFVDQPTAAAVAADGIVYRVMEERGYPMGDFDAQAGLVSVDHPQVVENYRIAHGIQQRADSKQATTEDLRDALLRYRTLFDELLRVDGDTRTQDARADASPADVTQAEHTQREVTPAEDTQREVTPAEDTQREVTPAEDLRSRVAPAGDTRDEDEPHPAIAADEEQPAAGRARQPIRNTGRNEGI